MKTEAPFCKFAKENSWRLKRDQDGCWIAPTRSRKFPRDHMFDGFSEHFGVSIQRNTKREFSAIIKKLKALGCQVTQNGDLEANLVIEIGRQAAKVARLLKIKKMASNPASLRNFLGKRKQADAEGESSDVQVSKSD